MSRTARLLAGKVCATALMLWVAASLSAAWAQSDYPRLTRPALEALVAPIALYPDALLSQVLMAATYPQEVAEAARWSRERPALSGDAAVRTSAGWDWDPSVRSLTAFPWVLDTMASHMRWTEDLGEAFRTQPGNVMDAVQHLRALAWQNGSLRSNETTRVFESPTGIVIEAVEPRIVHVPHYDPRVAYGTWIWPTHPPVYWSRWHGYVDVPHRHHVVHWGPGVSVGGGFFFGGFDWSRREVRIVNTHSYYYRPRPVEIHRHVHPSNAASHIWRHDESRRHSARRHDHAAIHRHVQPREVDARRDQEAQQRQLQQQQRPIEARRETVPAPSAGTQREAVRAAPAATLQAAPQSGAQQEERDRRGGRARSAEQERQATGAAAAASPREGASTAVAPRLDANAAASARERNEGEGRPTRRGSREGGRD